VPNMSMTQDAILCTLSVNMSTKSSILWLKRKLKSFLMNNIGFYFRSTLTSIEFAWQTLEKIYGMAAEKYIACCSEFRAFHLTKFRQMNMKSGYFVSSNGQKLEKVHEGNSFIKRIDLIIAKIIYVVIHSFFKYLICNLAGGTVFESSDYQ